MSGSSESERAAWADVGMRVQLHPRAPGWSLRGRFGIVEDKTREHIDLRLDYTGEVRRYRQRDVETAPDPMGRTLLVDDRGDAWTMNCVATIKGYVVTMARTRTGPLGDTELTSAPLDLAVRMVPPPSGSSQGCVPSAVIVLDHPSDGQHYMIEAGARRLFDGPPVPLTSGAVTGLTHRTPFQLTRPASPSSDVIHLDDLVRLLQSRGVAACVEQTGGGCATVYASLEAGADGKPRRHLRAEDRASLCDVAIGPGWFDGPGWTNPRATTLDLCVGPDGEGSFTVVPTGASTEQVATTALLWLGFEVAPAVPAPSAGPGNPRRRTRHRAIGESPGELQR